MASIKIADKAESGWHVARLTALSTTGKRGRNRTGRYITIRDNVTGTVIRLRPGEAIELINEIADAVEQESVQHRDVGLPLPVHGGAKRVQF